MFWIRTSDQITHTKFSRPEQWSIFQGDGCFSPMMEWRRYLKILTITIDGSWQDQLLAAMVFQWFFQFWGPMVHNGYWKVAFNNAFFYNNKKIKFATQCLLIKMSTTETHCVWNLKINKITTKLRHILLKTLYNFFLLLPETVIGLFDICFS